MVLSSEIQRAERPTGTALSHIADIRLVQGQAVDMEIQRKHRGPLVTRKLSSAHEHQSDYWTLWFYSLLLPCS